VLLGLAEGRLKFVRRWWINLSKRRLRDYCLISRCDIPLRWLGGGSLLNDDVCLRSFWLVHNLQDGGCKRALSLADHNLCSNVNDFVTVIVLQEVLSQLQTLIEVMCLPQRDRLASSISPSLICRDGRVKGLHLEVSRIHWALTIIQCVSQPIFVIRRFLRAAWTEIDLGLDLGYMRFNLWQVALLLGRRHQSRHGYRSLEFRWGLPELHLRVHEGFREFLSDIAHGLPWLVLFWVLRNKFLSTNPLRLVMLPPFGSCK